MSDGPYTIVHVNDDPAFVFTEHKHFSKEAVVHLLTEIVIAGVLPDLIVVDAENNQTPALKFLRESSFDIAKIVGIEDSLQRLGMVQPDA